jgi:putative ABC transport system permease protein
MTGLAAPFLFSVFDSKLFWSEYLARKVQRWFGALWCIVCRRDFKSSLCDPSEAETFPRSTRIPTQVTLAGRKGGSPMENLRKDLRYAIRMLAKSPSFSLVAVLALGFGIGANTAIFSVFNGMLWRPLPVTDPQQLVVVTQKKHGQEFPGALSYQDFLDYRQLKSVFSDLVAFAPSPLNFDAGGRPDRAWTGFVSGNYFAMLGVEAIRGRTFSSGEGWVPGKDPLIVLGYKFWQQRFGSDPGIIGQTVQINQHAFTIIGVLPQSFHGTYYFIDPDFYMPLTMVATIDPSNADILTRRNASDFRVVGRLRPGVTPAKAQAAAEPTDRRLAVLYPDSHKDLSLMVEPELHARPEPGLGGFMATLSAVFMALVGLVLLIACANVANLILARANGRRREIATRIALGATRWRMVRQLLTESVLLAFLGGLSGLLLARWVAIGLLSIRLPTDIPIRLFDLQMDWRIFTFSFVAAMLTGLIAGIVPALQTSRTDLAETLKEGGRTSAGAGRHRMRNVLVIAQVSVSLMLLACAGFFIRSFQNSARVDMGFRVENVLLMSMDVGLQGYTEQRGQQFYRQLSDRVKALPGVRSAAISSMIPMGYDANIISIYLPEHASSDKSQVESSLSDSVQPAYFGAAGVPVIQGREFTAADTSTAPSVAIINEAFAKKIWPGQNPIGKTFQKEKNGPVIQVVGMTRTGKYMFLYESPQPYVYFPYEQNYNSTATLFIHTDGDPLRQIEPVREQVRRLDSALPVYGVTSMDAHVHYGKPLLPARLGAILVGAFGILGLALAAVGVYGVVSFSVSQRTQELGLRTALGAQRSDVLNLVLRQGLGLALVGVSIGLVLALALARAIRVVLYGVTSTDYLTLVLVSVLLFAVAFVASYIPALRATRLDPVDAIRHE